ncbi:MAG: hypothetical protein IPH18_12680 [Chitinophagaceae bacterium]|nr:hypothetical protein [Chitinophagaceae bacterium]MBK8951374.1 hypothetical protein [Chitinophagaceae bacterium]
MSVLERLKSGWTALKFVRVILGILVLQSGIAEGQTFGIVLGVFFTAFGLLTDGVCCAGGACYAPPSKKDTTPVTENIEYEELGSK